MAADVSVSYFLYATVLIVAVLSWFAGANSAWIKALRTQLAEVSARVWEVGRRAVERDDADDDDVDDELVSRADLKPLQERLQRQAELLETDATELDVVRKSHEAQLREIRELFAKYRTTTDEALEELVRETQQNIDDIKTLQSLVVGSDAKQLDAMRNVAMARVPQQDKTTRRERGLDVIQPKPPAEERICKNCVHFDLAEGQAIIAKNPIFSAAARHVSPNRMSVPVLSDDEGNVLPKDQQPKPPLRAKDDDWSLFGACGVKEIVLHQNDTCDKWCARPLAREVQS